MQVPGSIGEAVTEVAAGSTGGLGAEAADGLTAGAMEAADGSIAGVMGAEVPGSIAGRGRLWGFTSRRLLPRTSGLGDDFRKRFKAGCSEQTDAQQCAVKIIPNAPIGSRIVNKRDAV